MLSSFVPLPICVFIFPIYHFIFLSLSSLPFLPFFLNFFVLYLFVLYSFYPSFFLYHSASISLFCYVVWKHRLPASFFICFVFPSIHSSYSSSFILPLFLLYLLLWFFLSSFFPSTNHFLSPSSFSSLCSSHTLITFSLLRMRLFFLFHSFSFISFFHLFFLRLKTRY